jgi:hypothetical protein
MIIKCKNCGVEKRATRYKQSFCSIKCSSEHRYKCDLVDRKSITRKANEALRNRGLEKFKSNPTLNLSKRGYYRIYIPSVISKKGKGYWKYHHHYVWEERTGRKIEKGFCIHHKDGNSLNNEFNNLEYMSIREHDKLSKRILRGKDHPNYTHGQTPGTKTSCKLCGKEFIRGRSKQAVCSLSCASKWRWKLHHERKKSINK